MNFVVYVPIVLIAIISGRLRIPFDAKKKRFAQKMFCELNGYLNSIKSGFVTFVN